MRIRSIIPAAILAICLVGMSFGCAPTSTAIYPQYVTTVTQDIPGTTVPVTTYSYSGGLMPSDINIVIGGGYADPLTQVGQNQTFQWLNFDHQAHTVTAMGEYAGLFDFTLEPGQTVQYSLPNPDTYEYYCKLHTGESAVLVVGGAGD